MGDTGSASWRSGQNSVKRIANKEFWVPQEGWGPPQVVGGTKNREPTQKCKFSIGASVHKCLVLVKSE